MEFDNKKDIYPENDSDLRLVGNKKSNENPEEKMIELLLHKSFE